MCSGKSITVQVFIVGDRKAEHDPIFYRDLPRWLASGEMKYKEDVTEGF
jgi:NADPH-dependent curcumin reductase CurA